MNIFSFFYLAVTINHDQLKAAIWCAAVGVILAFVIIFFNKTVRGGFVRALLDAEALSPENAKTLKELGVENTEKIIKSYKKSAAVRRLVGTTSDTIDENSAFFIYPDEKERAKQQFGLRGNEILVIILGALFFIAVAITATLLL